MAGLLRGRYEARFAETAEDVRRGQRLRYLCFRGNRDDGSDGIDADPFDDRCHHLLVEEVQTGRLVCCFRLLTFQNGEDIDASYAAQFYVMHQCKLN